MTSSSRVGHWGQLGVGEWGGRERMEGMKNTFVSDSEKYFSMPEALHLPVQESSWELQRILASR